MAATSITTHDDINKIEDDISNVEVKQSDVINLDKLTALRAKSQAKQQENTMAAKNINKRVRSINFGIIGVGQAGSRISQCFGDLGYDAIAINTTAVDLKHIELPDSNKLLLEGSLGGAAKELAVGEALAQAHRSEITQLINDKLADSQINILCISLGGGSGAGSAETMIDILANDIQKPVITIVAMPQSSDDQQTKSNALETLAKLAKLTQSKKIHNLIVIDNAKLEAIYHDVSQMDFFQVANKAIIEVLDVFNTFSSTPSPVKGIDQSEWAKMLINSPGCSIYGALKVKNFEEDTAIAEAVIDNLSGNLLASGFDLKQSAYVGVIITANKEVWAKIPSSSINYAMSIIDDQCGSPKNVFKGIYTTDDPEPVVKVYSMFTGLLLPEIRIEQLKKEIKILNEKSKAKDEVKNISFKIDTGTETSVSAAETVRNKIAAKSSAFGKLMGGLVDKRK